MKIAHKPARKLTETFEDVAIRLRAEYAKHTPEQRKIYGDKPSEGTITAAWARSQCRNHAPEQRATYIARGMAMIYGSAAKSHAKQLTRSKKASQKSSPSSNISKNTIRFPFGSIVYDDERVADMKVLPIIDTFPKNL